MKKGFTMPEFIVTLVSVIIVFLLFTMLFAKVDLWTLRENCRISSWAEAKGSQYSLTGESAIALNCPRYKVNFMEGKTEIKEIKSNKKNNLDEAKDEEDYYRIMAEEMRGCWYQFHEGKVNVFDRGIDFIDTETNCYVCDEVNFEKEIPVLTYENLNKFLQDETMKNADVTYWEFLSDSDPELSELEYYQFVTELEYDANNLLKNQNFDRSEKYSLVFIKTGGNSRLWDRITWDATTFQGSYILPNSILTERCDEFIT